ncbi:MAG: hypothetical protein ACI835_000935 [Planctomycetota bacterium]|jgi:hypothetical protein
MARILLCTRYERDIGSVPNQTCSTVNAFVITVGRLVEPRRKQAKATDKEPWEANVGMPGAICRIGSRPNPSRWSRGPEEQTLGVSQSTAEPHAASRRAAGSYNLRTTSSPMSPIKLPPKEPGLIKRAL